jgi:hypothetical protein
MEKIMIKRIELREYQLESNDIDDCDDDGGVKDDSIREQKHQHPSSTNCGSF